MVSHKALLVKQFSLLNLTVTRLKICDFIIFLSLRRQVNTLKDRARWRQVLPWNWSPQASFYYCQLPKGLETWVIWESRDSHNAKSSTSQVEDLYIQAWPDSYGLRWLFPILCASEKRCLINWELEPANFSLVKKGEGVPFDYLKGNAENHAQTLIIWSANIIRTGNGQHLSEKVGGI